MRNLTDGLAAQSCVCRAAQQFHFSQLVLWLPAAGLLRFCAHWHLFWIVRGLTMRNDRSAWSFKSVNGRWVPSSVAWNRWRLAKCWRRMP